MGNDSAIVLESLENANNILSVYVDEHWDDVGETKQDLVNRVSLAQDYLARSLDILRAIQGVWNV